MSETFSIPNSEIEHINGIECSNFKKYVSPIINLSNRFTRSTSPKKLGIQVSDLFLRFIDESDTCDFDSWSDFCKEKVSEENIQNATDEILNKCKELAKVADSITKEEVRDWVEDLLYKKTYNGLNIQHIILTKIASMYNTTYVKASKKDEAKGIDGYINGEPYSVKPKSYYIQNPALVEWIDATMVFYDKTRRGLDLEIYKLKRGI